MAIPKQLFLAYCNATYRVDMPDGALDIRIGESSERIDTLLKQQAAQRWAFVTAQNPRSQRTEVENEQRRQALKRRVTEMGFVYFEGRGISPANDWPAESSLLIIGIPAAVAGLLGRSFEQFAIVAGELGAPARLLDCHLLDSA
jgi:Protein of unknown function (DUF3293)